MDLSHTSLFTFLQQVDMDHPNIIIALEQQGFSNNDDVMRLLDVDTKGLIYWIKKSIDDVKETAKCDPPDNVPRIFLAEVMSNFKSFKVESKLNSTRFETRVAELQDKIHHLEERNGKLLVEVENTKKQAKDYIAFLLKSHEKRLAEKDAEYKKQIDELKTRNQKLKKRLLSRASKEEAAYETEVDESDACMATFF
jgi:hypothetical protein